VAHILWPPRWRNPSIAARGSFGHKVSERSAASNAELLATHGAERFPVDVKRVSLDYTRRNFDDPITRVGEPLDDFEGGLFPSPSGKPRWLIAYNSAIRSKERIRYTVAHELGHYLLHRKPWEQIQCSPQDMSIRRGEYKRANRFAAGVLMPTDDYCRQVDGQPIDLELFRFCTVRYGVSLTTAILEWLSFTPELAVLVCSRDGLIDCRGRGDGGVSPRTVVHAHRMLSHALDDAVRHGVVPRNVAKLQAPPKVQAVEMAILDPDGIAALIANLRGHLMYAPAIVALFTGMRLGEILALRWSNVDLDTKLVRVREALEETKAHGLRFKPPKTKAGRRDIGLPEIVVHALREHRRQQLELRLTLGAGKPPPDALVFSELEGGTAGAERRVPRLGAGCRWPRHAGDHPAWPPTHSCVTADRGRSRHRHDQQAPWSCQPRCNLAGLWPYVLPTARPRPRSTLPWQARRDRDSTRRALVAIGWQ
jgi:hypothetical protein